MLQEIKEKKEASPYGMHDIRFLGYTPKQKIMEYYENNHVDLFINVSESEGIPVSIMEALSFGIPCIATNVGGVKEIIHSENGWLIAPDIQSQELAGYIRSVKNLETESYTSYRENARLSWEKNYSAKKNYTDFVMQLEGLQ